MGAMSPWLSSGVAEDGGQLQASGDSMGCSWSCSVPVWSDVTFSDCSVFDAGDRPRFDLKSNGVDVLGVTRL
jgi:hypothetical protein